MQTGKSSPVAEQQDNRVQQIREWIEHTLDIQNYKLEPASADASFRRYFRLSSAAGQWIIMDAPPEKEDCAPFVNVARLIESVGVHAPHIHDYNEAQGFMRLSDLGSTAYLDQLNDATADALYEDAIQSIVSMQTIEGDLPAYDEKLLRFEMSLFHDWYLGKHLGIELNETQQQIWNKVQDRLVTSALEQPQVFVHRDYHSRNLMVIDDNNPGVIDFQDAVIGAASYDLVSLIKDCYIAWPRDRQLHWINSYHAKTSLPLQREDFIQQLDLMGMQRHLKAVGIFSRLNHRDGKPGYLNDIPRTLSYIVDVCQRYDFLSEFAELLSELGLQGDPATLELIR